jgi:hypothetical protein
MAKNEKCCASCKTTKAPTQFYKNRTNVDGLSNYCKDCTKLNAKMYYQKKLTKEVKITNLLKGSRFDNTEKVENIVPKKVKISSTKKIENSLRLALIEKHLLTTLDLFNEFKQEYELLGADISKIKQKF